MRFHEKQGPVSKNFIGSCLMMLLYSQISYGMPDSYWGEKSGKTMVDRAPQARPVAPIEESSFSDPVGIGEREKSRGPASVVDLQIDAVKRVQKNQGYQETSIIVSDMGFFPSTLMVTEGVPVKLYLTGASQKSQCFMLDQFQVRKQVRNQKIEEVMFTPDQAGKFTFSCPINGAKGVLVVRKLNTDRIPASFEGEDRFKIENVDHP